MIIKKTSTGVYIKSLDVVESHLVGLVNRYFESDKDAILGNIDSIVNEAVKRVKDDLSHLFN